MQPRRRDRQGIHGGFALREGDKSSCKRLSGHKAVNYTTDLASRAAFERRSKQSQFLRDFHIGGSYIHHCPGPCFNAVKRGRYATLTQAINVQAV